MTTEEKLEKAIQFIKSIEKMSEKDYDVFNTADIENRVEGECENCGETVDIYVNLPWNNSCNKYIDSKVIDNLKDKAWHVLFDLEN